tara:strand:- start:1759 stop:1938 length:180 start_codon:yes stop_codon:yes gene_type:complete
MINKDIKELRMDALKNCVKTEQKINGLKRTAVRKLLSVLNREAIAKVYAIAIDRNNHIK